MKLYTILAFALIGALLFALPFALAEETATAAEAVAADDLTANPGIAPDSSMYGLKLGWEKLGVLFTFNQEKKAEKELALADRKLLEVRKMADKGNLKAMERAQAEHDKLVERAQARLENLQEDSAEAKVKDTAEKVMGLERALIAHENRIETLNAILAEKNLSDNARAAIESAVARMENKTAVMEQKLADKKEGIKTKLRAVTEKSESKVNDEMQKLENKTGLTADFKAIAEHRVAKTEAAIAKLKEKVAEEKAAGINISSDIATHIADAESLIADAKELITAGKYAEAIKVLKPVSNYGRNLSWVMHKINEARQDGNKEDVKALLKNASEEKTQLGEDIKQKLEDFKNQTLVQREKLKEQLRNKTGL